jgi:hypothetical protein
VLGANEGDALSEVEGQGEVEAFYPLEKSSWLGRTWPLAIAWLIFLIMGGLELLVARFPQALALGPLDLAPPPWQAPVTWEYELRNVLDEPVGKAECSLADDESAFGLDCSIQQEAFEAENGSSFYQTGAYELVQAARWERDNLHLLEAAGSQHGDDFDLAWSLRQAGDGLVLETTRRGQPLEPLTLPADALLENEWPWRLPALPFSVGYSRRVTLSSPLRWSEEAQDSIPLTWEEYVIVAGSEPVATPAGNFITWKVTLGDQTAWYDAEPPHTLVRFDNGFESFVLVGVK